MSKSSHAIALKEVDDALTAAAAGINPEKARERAFFMKTQMPLLGLTVPQQRKLLRRGYSFSREPADRQLEIWDFVWTNARFHETRMQAGFFVDGRFAELPADTLWARTRDWAASINCWDQSDTLSGVFSRLLEAAPGELLPTLSAWNNSENPWLRRQSLVSLLYYSRFRIRYPPQELLFEFAENRLPDDNYYVQKGLGWMLREAFAIWPDETYAFLEFHIQVLSPAAWQAATKKLAPDQKSSLKAQRKPRRLRR